jgi:hypothetical protein
MFLLFPATPERRSATPVSVSHVGLDRLANQIDGIIVRTTPL